MIVNGIIVAMFLAHPAGKDGVSKVDRFVGFSHEEACGYSQTRTGTSVWDLTFSMGKDGRVVFHYKKYNCAVVPADGLPESTITKPE